MMDILRKHSMKKVLFPKTTSAVMLWWLHTIPYRISLDCNVEDSGPFLRRIYIKSWSIRCLYLHRWPKRNMKVCDNGKYLSCTYWVGTLNLLNNTNRLVSMSYDLKTYGCWTFSSAAPAPWNELPQNERCCGCLNQFKRLVKFYLFKKAFNL